MLDKMFGIGVLLSLQNRLSPVAKKARQDLQQLEGKVDDLEARLKRFDGFRSLANKGRTLTTNLTLPILATAGLLTKTSMDMGRAMGQVATLIPGQEKRVAELKTFVEETAMATGKSTDDLATATYQSISLLGDAAGKTETFIATASKAAVAGQSSVTDAVNLIGGVLRAYNMDIEESSRVSDLLFTTVKLGATTFPELASSMGRVLGMGASLKVPLEDITAAFATLTGTTGNTAEVSTQLANVLNKFLQPTQTMEKALSALGFSSGKAMLASKGLAGSLKILKQYSELTGVPIAELFPDVEGLRAALALTGANAEKFTENLDAMRGAAGATDEAFKAQTEGVGEAAYTWDKFQQKLKVIAIRAGDEVAPAFIKILDSLNPLLNAIVRGIKWFSNLPQPIQTTALAGLGLAAALGPVTMIIGNLGMMVTALGPRLVMLGTKVLSLAMSSQTLTSIIVGLRMTLSAMLGPVGLIITGVGLLYTAWTRNWFGIRDVTTNMIKLITEKIKGFVNWVKNTSIGKLVTGIAGKISGLVGDQKETAPFSGATAISGVGKARQILTSAKDAVTTGAKVAIDKASQVVAGAGTPPLALAAAGAGGAVPISPVPYQVNLPEPKMIQQASTSVREGDSYNITVNITGSVTREEARDIGSEIARAIQLEKERRPK